MTAHTPGDWLPFTVVGTMFLPNLPLPYNPATCAAFVRAHDELHRDDCGRFAAVPRDAPLCTYRAVSAPHVAGHRTKRAKWVALRDARSAALREER